MTLRPCHRGRAGCASFLFVVISHDEVNALLLLRCKEAVGLKEASLVPVQVILLYMLNPVFDLCVPNEKIHRGVEKIRKGGESANVRLNVVVFIFINRLLTDSCNLSQLLLADAVPGPQVRIRLVTTFKFSSEDKFARIDRIGP